MRRIKLSLVVVALAASTLIAVPNPASASPGVPSAPKSVKPAPGNSRAKVTWVAPYSDGGHKVTAYKITTYHDEVALAVNVFRSTATAQTIVGLTNGKAYTFTVSAKNVTGWSRFSARSPAVKVGIPGAPAPATSVPGVGKATVSWHAPAANGAAIDSYRVTPYLAGAGQPGRIFKSSQTHQVLSGLQHGKRYQFKVAAHNHFGWSDPSAVSKTVVVK